MQFVCSQSELNTHLSLVSRAIPARPSRPVLGNVFVQADTDTQRVTLIGFDETLGIQTSFSAQVDADGTLTLPAKLLGDIVSKLPAEDLEIREEDTDPVVILRSNSGEYQVRGLGADDYPSLPLVEDGQAAQLSAERLLEGLKGVLFAASADETKQILMGVHLLAESDSLEFAATDSHRLAVVQTLDEAGPTLDMAINVTVPGKALRELERILQTYQGTEPVALRMSAAQVIFELGDQRITTRLLEGEYPAYQRLIPRQFQRQLTLDRKLLMAALERVAVLAGQHNDIVKLSIDHDAQQLALSAEAQEVGRGRELLSAQITGEDLDVAFNVRYLLDGLKSFPSSEVQIQCNSATEPTILSPLGGLKMTYLVMPVQIRS